MVVADHGPSPRGAGLIPVESFRIPGLILWEGGLDPGVIEGIASLVDVPRTIVALSGLPHAEPFFGRDLLAAGAPVSAGIAPVEHDYRPGIVTAEGVTVLMRGAAPVAFTRDRAGVWRSTETRAADVNRAVALFQTANERWTNGSGLP